MSSLPNCPKCNSEYTYEDGNLLVCPECAYEWSLESAEDTESAKVVKDANGNILNDGDSITVIKDLKVLLLKRCADSNHSFKVSLSWLCPFPLTLVCKTIPSVELLALPSFILMDNISVPI